MRDKNRVTPAENNRLRLMMGRVVTHFKGKKYLVMDVAINSETDEEYVVYKALYGKHDTYIRPIKMFLSRVDEVKYPNVEQVFRFELDIEE